MERVDTGFTGRNRAGVSDSAALLGPSAGVPRVQTVAPPPTEQGLLLPQEAELVYPQSGMLGTGSTGAVGVQTHGSTQVRHLPLRPGDARVGQSRPSAQVPGRAADVLPAGEHGGEAGRHGRVGSGEVGAGQGRVCLRVHDSEVDSVRRHAVDPVVLRDGGLGGESGGGWGPRREQERPEYGVGFRCEEGGVVGAEEDGRGERRVRGGGGGGGVLGGEWVWDGDTGGVQEQCRGVRRGGRRVEDGGGGVAGNTMPEVVRRG